MANFKSIIFVAVLGASSSLVMSQGTDNLILPFQLEGDANALSARTFPDILSFLKPQPATTSKPDYSAYTDFLAQLYKLYQIPFPSASTAAPTTAPATTANPSGCKPDQVKIIIVDDCDEKHSKSSESWEDSEEDVVLVPHSRYGRRQVKKSNCKN